MALSPAAGECSPVKRLRKRVLTYPDCWWLIVVDLATTIGLRRWAIVYFRRLRHTAFYWHAALNRRIARVSQSWSRNCEVRQFRSFSPAWYKADKASHTPRLDISLFAAKSAVEGQELCKRVFRLGLAWFCYSEFPGCCRILAGENKLQSGSRTFGTIGGGSTWSNRM
jgi:hypothetical protein